MGNPSKTLLAIDTIIGSGSISIWREGVELGSQILESDAPQSETLLESLEQLLNALSIELEDMEQVAVSVGPGSYTGIRVGISHALGFAVSSGVETIGVSTLAVLAAGGKESSKCQLAVLSIGGNDLISQEFKPVDSKLDALNSPEIIKINQLANFSNYEIITDLKTITKIGDTSVGITRAPDNIASEIGRSVINNCISFQLNDLSPIYSRDFTAK